MCSIVGILGLSTEDDCDQLRLLAVERSQRQRHRGPDWSGVYCDLQTILAHERLAIVDPAGGAQPLVSADGAVVLAVNGEIYNHTSLRSARSTYAFTTESDCEVISALYVEMEPEAFLPLLNGIFAFVLWDRANARAILARDPIGVCPLYWGHDAEGRLWVASELKALADICNDVAPFPPGHFYDSKTGTATRYYSKPWRRYEETRDRTVVPADLRAAFQQAVDRQLMSDVPYGVLLSGGLDSSLVAMCAAGSPNAVARKGQAFSRGTTHSLHSFAIGLEHSPDLAAAQVAADAIGTVHHGFEYTVEEGFDALSEVIRHIETYDVTTIRAATPMYLLARRIKALGIKMVLSGEGADEVFGGYLYFHRAPSAEEFHAETVRKLDALHLYDCLRANKAMMAWGVEARVPFLDLEFLDVAMKMDARVKMVAYAGIEKGILREAFDGLLPETILWRQKEQFSDGVGYGWIDSLKARAEQQISDREFRFASSRFPINTPATKEAYVYRKIFERHYPGHACALTVPGGKSIACSSPAAIAWHASFAASADPSGRSVKGVHAESVIAARPAGQRASSGVPVARAR